MLSITCAKGYESIIDQLKTFQEALIDPENEFSPEEKQEFIDDMKREIQDFAQTPEFMEYEYNEEALNTIYELINSIGDTPTTKQEIFSWMFPDKTYESVRESVNDSLADTVQDYTGNTLQTSNFIEKVYMNTSATNVMLKYFRRKLINDIMLNLKEEEEILGNNESLNKQIHTVQQEMYEDILEYINQIDPNNNLPKNLREGDNVTIAKLDDYFQFNTNKELKNFYNFSQNTTTLTMWRHRSISEKTFLKKLTAYNAYFILKHFDSLLINEFKTLIRFKFKDKLVCDQDKYEFNLKEDANKILTWQQEDLQQKGAYDVIPKSLQILIESFPILSNINNSESETGVYLKKDHIVYFTQIIKRDFRFNNLYNRDALFYVNTDDIHQLDLDSIINLLQPNSKLIDVDKYNNVTLEQRSIYKRQIAQLIKDKGVQLGKRRYGIYLQDIVNKVRGNSAWYLKLLFDTRNILNTPFKSSIEKRVFDNLYHYLFKDRNSVYSTSNRIFNQIAQLFDTTSIIDYTQYRIRDDGTITLNTLNPRQLDTNLSRFKESVNSQFVAGECDDFLVKYNVNSEYKNPQFIAERNEVVGQAIRRVSAELKNFAGDIWRFSFDTRQPNFKNAWILSKYKAGEDTPFQLFTRGKNGTGDLDQVLTETDFNVVCQWAKDILQIDLINNKELRIAFLDKFRNADQKYDFNRAAIHVINSTLPILVNIKLFREKKANPSIIQRPGTLKNDQMYTVRILENNLIRELKFYTTENDKPYTKTIKKDNKDIEVVDIDTLRMRGLAGADHITHQQLNQYLNKGFEIGNPTEFSYDEAIKDWYGDDQKSLRTSRNYQGIDLISSGVSNMLEEFVEAQTLVRGEAFKTQVRTAENTSLTIGQSSMLIAEKFSRISNYVNALDPVNIMIREFMPAFKGYAMSREGVNGYDSKQHKDFNFKESAYSSFVMDFLLPVYMGRKWDPRFTESVSSDKPNVPKVIIDLAKILTAEDAEKEIKYTLGDTYRNCFVNIENDFKTIKKTYDNKYNTDIPLSIRDNFTSFNEWCHKQDIDPFDKFREIVFLHNSQNRHNPIAFANNVHYHVNRKTHNLELGFSFIEALSRFTLLSPEEYQERIDKLTIKSKDTTNLGYKVAKEYEVLLEQIKDQYKNLEWNSIIFGLIRAQNTKEQLGSSYESFINRFIDKDGNIAVTTNFVEDSYKKFIKDSNLEFISDLLKNDVVIDLHALEGHTELYHSVYGIFNNIPEYKQKLLALEQTGMTRPEAQKELVSDFASIWFTQNWDRMAFGIVEVQNDNGEWVTAYEKIPVRVDEESLKEEYILNPVQLSTRADLAILEGTDNNNTKIEFYKNNFKLSQLNLKYKGKKARIKVNPIFEQFNLNSFYWSTLSSFTSVGSHIWADAKKGTNTLQEESYKWFDNNKRNVITSATKLQYLLGDTWGTLARVNVAVLEDVIAECSGIMGDIQTVKPYDGATWVSAFQHHWENYSLNNQITGVTKKPIIGAYDPRTAAGELIKTATYALTNAKMRNSFAQERLHWKMSHHIWTDPDGNELDVNLTLFPQSPNNKFPANPLGIARMQFGVDKEIPGAMYYDTYKGKKVVKEIVSFEKVFSPEKAAPEVKERLKNTYIVKTRIRNINPEDGWLIEDGGFVEEKKTVKINNNYDFWKVLGKYNSVTINKDGKFEYSENSIKIVADTACKVRFKRVNGTLQQLLYDHEAEQHGKKFTYQGDNRVMRNADLYWQPMKESEIHYVVTEGAIKKYAANINSKADYFTDKDLNFFKTDMYDAGIQLDPTHEADQSTVSMMTQVISALSERGYTQEKAQEVYEALAALTSLTIADSMTELNKVFSTNDRAGLQEIVSKLIIDELVHTSSATRGANIPRAIAERLISEAKQGKHLNFKDTEGVFAFSDPSTYSMLRTVITSSLNKKAIRTKLYGVLAVLNPSHDQYKICGNKLLSEIETFEELERTQQYLPKGLKLSQTEIGRTYEIVIEPDTDNLTDITKVHPLNGQLIHLQNSDYYYLWKFKLAGLNYSLNEVIYKEGKIYDRTTVSNDIYEASTNQKESLKNIKDQIIADNNQFNFFKITYIEEETGLIKNKFARISDVNDFEDNILSVQKIDIYGRNLGSHNIHLNGINSLNQNPLKANRYDIKVVQDNILGDIQQKLLLSLSRIKQREGSLYNPQRALEETFKEYGVKQELQELWMYVANLKTDIPVLDKVQKERLLQKDLLAIQGFKNLQIYDENMNVVDFKVNSYDVKKFEALLPPIYATQFGIRKGDTLSDIMTNSKFFLNRLLENYIGTSNPGQKDKDKTLYDICLKRADGKHIYLKYSESPEVSHSSKLHKQVIETFTDDDGTFRMNDWKPTEKLYPLSSTRDSIYYDNITKQEIISTDNLAFYLSNLNYVDIEFNNSSNSEIIMQALNGIDNKYVCTKIKSLIEKCGSFNEYIKKQEEFVNLIIKYLKTPGKDRGVIESKFEKNYADFYNKLKYRAKKMRAAFNLSQLFTVARIPAQGMQSFMAMEIVGFTESDVNDCYVSAEQIRLQGSDYDVDKATFMGFAFNQAGEFSAWSPYFQMNSWTKLEESLRLLPYPTGRKSVLESGTYNSIDYSKYVSLFELNKQNTSNTSEEDIEANSNDTSNTTDSEINNTQNQVSKKQLKYKLKSHRTREQQELLANLLRDVKKAQQQYFTKHQYDRTAKLYYDPNTLKDEDLILAFQVFINKHNNYINVVNKEEKTNISKNFVAWKTIEIAEAPANAIAAGTTVDQSAAKPKQLGEDSNAGTRPQDSRPGNSSIMGAALNQNHTGKGVIGIAASAGMKVLHTTTQATNNAIANNANISNILFDVVIKSKNGTDKHYYSLADIYLGEGTKQEIIDKLVSKGVPNDIADALYERSINHTEWAGSNNSGIMTLATDNAKELKLERLNAGSDLAGLYLYGIAIGMEFEDIFKIMTSQTAQVLSRMMKSNIFTEGGSAKFASEILDILSKDRKTLTNTNISTAALKLMNTQFNELGLGIQGIEFDGKSLDSLFILKGKGGIRDTVIEVTKTGEFNKYLQRLKLLKGRIQRNEGVKAADKRKYKETDYRNRGYSYDEVSRKRSIDNLISYAVAIHEIADSHIKEFGYELDPKTQEQKIRGNMWADLENLKTLEAGEHEMGKLRELLGLNQGQKTKTEEAYRFYNNFTRIIKEGAQRKNLSKETKETIAELLENDDLLIDFWKFFKDLNYRNKVIKVYDDYIKQSFNPLWVATNVPHFNQYLQTANVIFAQTGNSLKDRMMLKVILPFVSNKLQLTGKKAETFYKKGETWINSLITNAFLREEVSYIEIPAHNKIFSKPDGEGPVNPMDYKVYDTPTYIELGTREGNETFRVWMNTEVLPRLSKQGLLFSPSVTQKQNKETIRVLGADGTNVNTFLRDLIKSYSNRTADRNNITVHTLPIDMIPKSDVEQDAFSKYQMDLFDLRTKSYKVSDDTGYNIADLLFYYNLINFRNESGGKSLTPMFEPFVKTNEDNAVKRYYDFIGHMDTNYDFQQGVDYTTEMLEIALAPHDTELNAANASSKNIPYYYRFNRQTLRYDLYKLNKTEKIDNEEIDEFEGSRMAYGYMGQYDYFLLDNVWTSNYDTPEMDTEVNFDKYSSIRFGNGVASAKLVKNNNKTEVTIKLNSFNNKVYNKELTISEKELKKILKVGIDKNGDFIFKVNPLAIVAKASTMIRENCI